MATKVLAIIQARLTSTRLPKKVLLDLHNKKVIDWIYQAASQISGLDAVVIATSADKSDDELAQYCEQKGMNIYRGNLNDVLGRFYEVATYYKADTIMRLTADCPFLDSHVCGEVLYKFLSSDVDYISNINPPTFPDGLDCEVFSYQTLKRAYENAKKKSEREHVTVYIRNNRYIFKTANVTSSIQGLHSMRWTLDTKEDLEFLSKVAEGVKNPNNYLEVLGFLKRNPGILEINHFQKRNEGLAKSAKFESEPIEIFNNSVVLLEKAEKTIPLGTQTFSKSKIQYPKGFAPLYVTHGLGGRIWDVDGNEYVDMVNGLLPNLLGYCDPDVNYAIKEQLSNGISFSLATDLESKLSEELVRIIPCAESVRFGKNGSDATSAAIRLARAFTGRDRVIVCGYHGWQDWYIGSTTRNKGVPKAVQDLTDKVPYNDLKAVEELLSKNDYAALILEPMNVSEPDPDYLNNLKKLLHSKGTLLIFDEIITGFRYSLGGAQEYFGVTPDLASFGKSMGNGMPISAVVGRKDIMNEMENVFFSGTFGGETLSIVASLAVIDKIKKENVIEKIWSIGDEINKNIRSIIDGLNLTNCITINGRAPWTLFGFNEYGGYNANVIKSYVLYHLHRNGVLTAGSHNICFAHDSNDIQKIVNAYNVALGELRKSIDNKSLEKDLKFPALVPVFQVRS